MRATWIGVIVCLTAFLPSALSAQGTAIVMCETPTNNKYEAVQCTASGYPIAGSDAIEDAAETAAGYLSMMGAVRRDTAASSAGTTGDNTTLNTDANGKLWANCEITGGTAGAAATFAAMDATASGSIGAAYASAVNLPDDTKVVILDNQTNGDVTVSMDGGTSDTFHMKAGDSRTLNLASNGLETTADVQLKDGTSASTSGSFYVYSYK